MTFVLVGFQGSGNFSLRSERIRNVRDHALQALFPLPRGLRPVRELLWKFRSLGLPPLLFPALQGGRIRGGGGSQGAPGVVSREASSPPARPRSSERGAGGSVSGYSSVARERASVSSAPSGAGEGEVARS